TGVQTVSLPINWAGLFFRFSEYAAPETQAQFYSAYEEVWKKNDQKDGFSFGDN
ncbi:transcriptional regulator, partial [Paenibacillus sp. 28ISP30-2]|nr:transcriptional regulator [Paenibacillus sp. 28ISP30-2]